MQAIFGLFYRPGIYLYAALKLLVITVFTFSLVYAEKANAKEQLVCAGDDLIAQYSHSQPQVLAALEKQADATLYGSSRLWKISKDGIADSWLFGTMHVTNENVVTLPTMARAGFDASQTVLVEITGVSDKKKLTATILKIKHLLYRQDGLTIEADIGADHMAKLAAAIKARSMPYEVAIRMQPWMLGPAISAQLCEVKAKTSGKLFLDAKIMQMALGDAKQLVPLETMQEQLEIMADLPRSFHIASLVETLALGDKLDDLKQTMQRLYLEGRISMIVPLVRHVSGEFAKSTQYADFLDRMLRERNGRMAQRAAKYFANGKVFMAVGALHLPGEHGLAALLQAQGFDVSAVETLPVTD